MSKRRSDIDDDTCMSTPGESEIGGTGMNDAGMRYLSMKPSNRYHTRTHVRIIRSLVFGISHR